MIRDAASPLLTDLYQLTMLQAYRESGFDDIAVFEFFVRALPEHRNFLIAAGLESVLVYLEHLQFEPDELDWLRNSGKFSADFVNSLADLRFTGDVHAVAEGRVFFANEPILRVTAPIAEAQLIESRVINILHQQTLVASKAARCVLSAPGRTLLDFGMRRAHGAEAAMGAARSSYLAGFTGTATVLAGLKWDIPIFGTMAHSFIQAHGDEISAFRDFAMAQPDNVVLLIDTYDTLRGARRVVELSGELAQHGIAVRGVRLDSGDLTALSKEVRTILDAGGCNDVAIFVSGNLDEYSVRDLLASGAPIDGFGIGTRLDVSQDSPSLDCVYKLQEYARQPRRKRSSGKATWPGRKQVRRSYDPDGLIQRDVLCLDGEPIEGEPLLEKVMTAGDRCGPGPTLAEIRATCAADLDRLPPALTALETAEPAFTATVSSGLTRLADEVDRRFA